MLTRLTALLFFSLLLAYKGKAQEIDLLNDSASLTNEPITGTFKSTRVLMSHSVEMLPVGVLDFRVLHRFGTINHGLKDFFGLDQATTRLGLDYGISDNLTVGIGRGTFKKELDGFLKYRLIQQSKGLKAAPVSLVFAGGITLNTLPWSDPTRENYFSSRLAYYTQAIIGRKFTSAFSLQLMPTYLHRNLVAVKADPNNLFATGIGGRIKISKRTSLNADYYYVFNRNKNLPNRNPFSIGFDIETGGHVFQLHFTNASGMNERAFLTDTFYNLFDGDIQFGFNISRVFQVKKRKR
jgi:hypothetical protein